MELNDVFTMVYMQLKECEHVMALLYINCKVFINVPSCYQTYCYIIMWQHIAQLSNLEINHILFSQLY